MYNSNLPIGNTMSVGNSMTVGNTVPVGNTLPVSLNMSNSSTLPPGNAMSVGSTAAQIITISDHSQPGSINQVPPAYMGSQPSHHIIPPFSSAHNARLNPHADTLKDLLTLQLDKLEDLIMIVMNDSSPREIVQEAYSTTLPQVEKCNDK